MNTSDRERRAECVPMDLSSPLAVALGEYVRADRDAEAAFATMCDAARRRDEALGRVRELFAGLVRR